MKRQTVFIILGVLAGFMAFVAVIIAVVFYATSGVSDAADRFYATARGGTAQEVYALTSTELRKVTSNIFTHPEIATVGWSQRAVDAGEVQAVQVTLPLAGNARAKMQGVRDGFVKLFCRPGTGLIEGGVIVAPRASELIHPVALAVSERLTADQLAHAFTVYPSMSGSVAEAARRLHRL